MSDASLTTTTSTDEVKPSEYPKAITEAITKIMASDLYIQKRGVNEFHRYKYATVGDLLDKLHPLLAEAGLVIIQNETGIDMYANGSVMAVTYEFTLAHTSGAVWPEKPRHTGMSACLNSKGGFDDKAANKCHTAARKYFLLGLFQVPTGDDYREVTQDGDPDGQDHAPPPPRRPNGSNRRAEPTTRPPLPANPEEPPEVAAARIAARAAFWQSDDYGIDPAEISGGLANWSSEMLARAEVAPNLDAFNKLKDDNRPYFETWAKAMQPAVVRLFNEKLRTAYQRVAKAEGVGG